MLAVVERCAIIKAEPYVAENGRFVRQAQGRAFFLHATFASSCISILQGNRDGFVLMKQQNVM
jgi:hypothetical protein